MNLTETPEIVIWPEMHYVFIERVGPFRNTAPLAWQNVHQLLTRILENNRITGYTSLYKVAPQTYRAGVSITALPNNLPEGVQYATFNGGKYSRFLLTGPYTDLPAASSRVFQIVAQMKIQLRDDFCIENYLNDPRITHEPQLLTEILIPTA